MRLVYEKTGVEVKVGDPVTLRGGVKAKVTYFSRPHSPASNGKVNVRCSNSCYDDEFYVSVIGAKWIEREDRGEVSRVKICASERQVRLDVLFEENPRVKRSVEQYYEEIGLPLPEQMKVIEVLDAYLKRQGILGFTSDITDIFDTVKES